MPDEQDLFSILATDWEGFELRFSTRELAVVGQRLGVATAGVVPPSLVPEDVSPPDSPVSRAIEGALLARDVLRVRADSAFALGAPSGALLAAALGAALRITATSVGVDVVARRRWHVRDDIVISQRMVDPAQQIFGFSAGVPTSVLSDIITECGLPDTRADSPESQNLDLMALMWTFLDRSPKEVAGEVDSSIWIEAELADRPLTRSDSSIDLERHHIRLVQQVDVDIPGANGVVHRQVAWAFDDDGRRWMTAAPDEPRADGMTKLVEVGGRDILDSFVSKLSTASA